MHLTVLTTPDCPNAPVLEDRLAAVLDGRAGVTVSRQVIRDEGEAARWGMRGSPTLLVDGLTRSRSWDSPRAWRVGCTVMMAARCRARPRWVSCGR